MIKLQFSVAVALYILVALGVIFGFWIFTEIKKRFHSASLGKILWECPICANVYRVESDTQISQCPKCLSFNKRSDKAGFNLDEERKGESEKFSQVSGTYPS